MAQTADPVKLRVACQLMYLYLVNLVGAPTNHRYRKIFTGNDNFKKVDAVDGAKSLLVAVGFGESPGCLEWLGGSSSTTDEEEGALRTVQEVLQALSILKTGQPSPELEAKALAVLSMENNNDTVPSTLHVDEEPRRLWQGPPAPTATSAAEQDEPTNVDPPQQEPTESTTAETAPREMMPPSTDQSESQE